MQRVATDLADRLQAMLDYGGDIDRHAIAVLIDQLRTNPTQDACLSAIAELSAW